MLFWIVSAALSAGVALTLLMAAEGRGRAEAVDAVAQARADLEAVEADIAKGALDEVEAAALRTEIKRRVLKDPDSRAPFLAGQSKVTSALVALVPVVLGLSLYLILGQPGRPDLGLAARMETARSLYDSRPTQRDVDPPRDEFSDDVGTLTFNDLSMIAQLRAAVAERPDDFEGHALLAGQEARLGNYHAAWTLQARANELAGSVATGEDYARQAAWMIEAAHGLVTPEAEAVLQEAVRRDPENRTAYYFIGLLYLQTGRPDASYEIWSTLYRSSESYEPFMDALGQQMPRVAALAGQPFQPRADLTSGQGPDISGMVAGLEARLNEQGGSPAEWAMLIRSKSVMGDFEAAMAIEQRAIAAYDDDEEAQEIIRQALHEAATIGQ